MQGFRWGDWRRRLALAGLLVIVSLQLMPLTSHVQNLGQSPATGQGVQGQTAAQPEETVLNLANWIACAKSCFAEHTNMAIIATRESTPMRSVNIAELKNRLSRYLTFAKGGEEIVIRDRNLPVAKLVPFSGDEGSEDELLLVAAGKMRLPKSPVKVDELLRIPTGKVAAREGIQALLDDREESL
jgi:antitoxin (DNA-binding transcriptional repressor) of toxin-antitoxin stability system